MSPSDHANSARTIGFGIALGIIGAIVSYARMPALGFTLFIFLLVGVLFFNARLQNVTPIRRNLFILIPLLFFAVMFAVRSDETLTVLNLGAGIGAALLLVYFFASGNLAQQDILEYGIKMMVSGIAVTFQPFAEMASSWKWFRNHRNGWGAVLPVARGILITAPVLVVFVILLSSADKVFADAVSNILRGLTFSDPTALMSQTVLATIFGWSAVGGMAFALLDRKAKRVPAHTPSDQELPDLPMFLDEQMPAKKAPPVLQLGFTEMTILLGSVCAVFGAFVAIQFVYLFGGARNIDVSKFNYADYVHRGFAELVIVGVLALGLAYTVKAVTLRSKNLQENIFRGLSTLLMALTGVILISAFERMRLYEYTYGFTTLRLMVYVFIAWLGVLFVGFTLSLYWKPATINVFGLTTLVAAFGFVMTLDVLNPDAFVAGEMISRNDVDPLYLESLGTEAIPAMESLVDAPEPGLRDIVRNTLARRQNDLTLNGADWRSFSLGNSSALSAEALVKDKATPNYRLGDTAHKLSEFDFLKKGMNFRQIVRQLGEPYAFGSAYYRFGYGAGDLNTEGDLYVNYLLDDGSQVSLVIDSSAGLSSACTSAKRGSSCDQTLDIK